MFLANLRARFGKFEDGSSIRRISREEYVYRERAGRAVAVYVYLVVEKNSTVDRVLVRSTINHWAQPSKAEKISETEQQDIIDKFRRYFRAFRQVMQVD